MKKYDIVYHLSHNDLDGYGSQFATSMTEENIVYLNTSYLDVAKNINEVYSTIVEKHKKDKILFLITDVSLDEKLAKKINNFWRGNKNIDLTVQVLDHHKTNEEVSDKNEWYHFDNDKCATLITCNWVKENFNISNKSKKDLDFFGDFVDSHDRWLEEHPMHHKANYLSDIVFEELKYPEMIEENKRDSIFYVIKEAIDFFKIEENTIYGFEKKFIDIINEHLTGKISEEIINNKDIRYKHKMCSYFAKLYAEENTKTFKWKDKNNIEKKYKVMLNLSRTNLKYMSYYYLEDNKDIDFIINIKSKLFLNFKDNSEEKLEELTQSFLNNQNLNEINLEDNVKIEKEDNSRFNINYVDKKDYIVSKNNLFNKKNIISEIISQELNYPEIMEDKKEDNVKFIESKAKKLFMDENKTVYNFEKSFVDILNEYFKGKIKKEIVDNKNIKSKHKMFSYFAKLYSEEKSNTLIWKVEEGKEYKFKTFFCLNSTIFQYMSHYYLNDNKDIDFMINVKSKNSASLRSKNDVDVGLLAKIYLDGGGHKNASGGRLGVENNNFKTLSELEEVLIQNFPVKEEVDIESLNSKIDLRGLNNNIVI